MYEELRSHFPPKMWPSPQANLPWKQLQLFTKTLAAELPFPQGICTVPRSASLGYECLREMPFSCSGWLHGRPYKRRFLFWGSHYCLVPCWFHVGATNFAADFINTFLGHFEWTGPSTKDSCTSFFIQGTTTCSMGHLQSPPQKCVLGIRGKQTHKWTWSKPF